MHAHDSRPPTDAVDASTPPSTLAALHQRELARLAELERRRADLDRQITEQQRRVRQAERLALGVGQV